MTNEDFFEEFGYLANAPDGIERLRKLILDLAVRGRLVSQDPNDEPASVLLERIAAERERLVTEGSIRKSKSLATVGDGEQEYPLPSGWSWTRLGDLCVASQYGWTTSASSSGSVKFLRTTDMSSGNVEWASVPSCAENPSDVDRYMLRANDILISRTGAGLGSSVVLSHDPPSVSVFASYLIRFRPVPGGVSSRYLGVFLDSPTYWRSMLARRSGTAIKNVNATNLSKLQVPIPPAAEQSRIFERVEELTGMCDELEVEQVKSKELRAATARSSLSALVKSDRADTEQALSVIKDHLRLSLRPGDGAAEVVTELRKAILDLAVRGRLVPQNPSDEPASVLLEHIAAERDRLNAEGKIKRGKSISPKEVDEASVAAPGGWEVARLAEVGIVVRGVTYAKSDARKTPDSTLVPLLRANNIQSELDLTDLLFVPEDRVSAPQRLNEADIVMCMSSGSANLVGKSTSVTASAAGFTFGAFCAAIKPVLIGEYLAIALKTPLVLQHLMEAGRGIGINNLRMEDLRGAPVPLPPAAEQLRIVERVNELTGLCDELERQLLEERELAADLAEATISSLLAQVG